ncbi:MAG: nucleotidyltransferase domain-containing protein, partial [Chitinivibrionales bacterium]
IVYFDKWKLSPFYYPKIKSVKKKKVFMTFQEIKEFSTKTIREEFAAAGISISQIILFGSRSRGNARPDSDWDFLVSVKDDLSFPEKAIISAKVQTMLAEKLISADVIITNQFISNVP